MRATRLFGLTGALLLVGALATAAVSGCAASAPTEVPGITGEITYFATATDPATLANITVEGGDQPEGAVSDKAVVAVTKQTAVLDAGGQAIDVTALTVGTQVKVWFTGPVAESYPVQGIAAKVQTVGTSQ